MVKNGCVLELQVCCVSVLYNIGMCRGTLRYWSKPVIATHFSVTPTNQGANEQIHYRILLLDNATSTKGQSII